MSGDFDVAGICAHPDDAELIMGGTLALQSALGRRVALVDLTRGECGSRGDAPTRDREAQEAARILGVAHRESLGLPDARLEPSAEQKDVVIEAVRRLRPRVVVTQLPEQQRHPDHAAAGRIVYEACFVAGLKNYRPDLGPPFRPHKVVYAMTMTEAFDGPPSFVVDVAAVWETKLRACRAFASQFTPGTDEPVPLPFENFQKVIELAARRHGQRIGSDLGEGFLVREPMRVVDLRDLDVRSY